MGASFVETRPRAYSTSFSKWNKPARPPIMLSTYVYFVVAQSYRFPDAAAVPPPVLPVALEDVFHRLVDTVEQC